VRVLSLHKQRSKHHETEQFYQGECHFREQHDQHIKFHHLYPYRHELHYREHDHRMTLAKTTHHYVFLVLGILILLLLFLRDKSIENLREYS
jgi:hypothetical protein